MAATNWRDRVLAEHPEAVMEIGKADCGTVVMRTYAVYTSKSGKRLSVGLSAAETWRKAAKSLTED